MRTRGELEYVSKLPQGTSKKTCEMRCDQKSLSTVPPPLRTPKGPPPLRSTERGETREGEKNFSKQFKGVSKFVRAPNIAMRRFPFANNENPRRKISTIFEHDFLAVSSVPDAFVKFSQLRWAQKNRLQMEGESRGRPVKIVRSPMPL